MTETTKPDLRGFLHAGPYEPLASVEEVLEIPCALCGAEIGQKCDTSPPRPTVARSVFGAKMPGVHMSRYQDRTHDPR